MNQHIDMKNEPVRPLSMHPQRFALWLFIVSIVMIFAAMTSAYIVKKSDGDWVDIILPQSFWLNTIVLVASSVTMHMAYIAAKRNNLNLVKIAMTITTILGLSFLVGQYVSWGELAAMDVHFEGKPAGSFIYVFTGLHGFHLISGVVFLIIVLVATFRFKVHSKSMNLIGMCATYWHFLDGLWVYLFIFLLLNH
ncbi:cytochrome c oxidase subunit 3 [Fulvivirgaceae bacterium BMA10]|uniref:Cytochrome c oxidase subunit 3 n=1 Tax=Splendidivirga corallicola TaxID=3051826 RepID=A0ABT8KRN4_9BACT|nr:cytochrome c oxidase subunit 3 [Fulvivirgaceae bacterium BMA10]